MGDSVRLAPMKEGFQYFSKDNQQNIIDWSSNGYIILSSFFTDKKCDSISNEIDRLLQTGQLHFSNDNKLMFANKNWDIIKDVTWQKDLTAILSFLLDKEVVPFQTINFITESQQRAHSDSIHITTCPLRYLVAVWIALEDIDSENGSLFYHKGSHKLPYLLNGGFNEGATALLLGKKDYKDYEDVLEEMIVKNNFKKQEFYAKKGDVFIWHANLVHGGSPILKNNSTRKSMVIHYSAEDVIKHHEITERPSFLSSD